MAGRSPLSASHALRRIAVVVAVIASALAVLPIAVQTPAAAAEQVDQQTTLACNTTNYPAVRNGGTFRQTFTPSLNRVSTIHLCVDGTGVVEGSAPVTVSIEARNTSGGTTSVGSVTRSYPNVGAAGTIDINFYEVGLPVVTPGVSYVLAVTMPAGIGWRGTDMDVDAYAAGGALEEGVGDFAFSQYADNNPELLITRGGFAAANTDVRLVEETFDTRTAGSTFANDIPGVSITTTEDKTLQIWADTETENSLFAISGGSSTNPYTYTAAFTEPARAVGFEIDSLDPAAGPVDVSLELTDVEGTVIETFELFDDDNNESSPFWFGFRDLNRSIVSMTVSGPPEVGSAGFEEFVIDDFTFERDVPAAIAFDRVNGGNRDIYVMNEDGSNPTRVTTAGTIDADPSISADGSRIAYACLNDVGRADVCVMDSDGTDRRNLTADLGATNQYNADPSISPDGSRIAFTSGDFNAGYEVFDVWVMNSDGTNKKELTEANGGAEVRDGFAAFSPDGSQIAFQRGNETVSAADLYRMPAEGGPATQITTFGNSEVMASWSPAGIAYVNLPIEGDSGIYVVNPALVDDTAVVVDAEVQDEAAPAWKPDGTEIAYELGGSIYKRVIGASTSVQLSVDALDANPSWSGDAGDEVGTATLEADKSTARAGVAKVDLNSIPSEYLALIASGEQAARLESAPAGSIPAGSIPAGSIPAGSIPAGSIPAGSIPAGSIDLEASPAGSIPTYSLLINDLPAGSIPAGSIPAGSIPAGSIGLNGTLLSALSLSAQQVDALLAGSDLAFLPRQTITLRQVLADQVVAPRFAQLDLAESGLAKTLFGSVGMAALLLGAHPINAIDVPEGASANPNATWCDLLFEQTGQSCDSLGINPNEHSFLGAQLAGAQIGSLPAGSIPAGSIPAGSIALWALAAGSIDFRSLPAGSIPAGSIALQGTPAGSIPAGSILVKQGPAGSIPAGSIPAGSIPAGSIFAKGTPAGSIPAGSIALQGTQIGAINLAAVVAQGTPAGSIPAGSIPAGSIAQVLTCGATQPACPAGLTLAEAEAKGMLRNTAELWMVGAAALANITVGDVIFALDPTLMLTDLTATELNAIQLWMIKALLDQFGVTLAEVDAAGALDGITLGDLPASAFADVELYEIILQILIRTDYPWESLPIEGMQDFAAVPNNEVGYTATASVACPASESATFDLDLGEFRYLGGTGLAKIDDGDAIPVAPAAIPGGKLRFAIPGACDGETHDVVLTFDALPGLRLGTNTADLVVTAGGDVQTLNDQAPVVVTENGEPDDASGRSEFRDRLIIGHISSPTDVDTITIPMPAKGTRMRVFLSHIPEGADYDLAISTPPAPGGPLQSTPAGSIPAGSIPLEDDGRSVDGSTALQNETLQDVPAGSIPAGSISANRGSEDEIAQVISNGATGNATVRITGYLGSNSTDHYVLRVREYDPINLVCDARTGITAPTDAVMPTPALGTESLFLVNTHRMYDLYDDLDVAEMLGKLETIADRPEVKGQIVPIEGDADVRTAFAEWDWRPCDIDAANTVVREINNVVTTYRTASGSLRNVVLVGTDELLPFARVPDLVTLSNEQDEVVDLAFTLTPDGKANALYAAAAYGYILTNDAYTSFTEVPWLDRQLHLPDVAASRLVETPKDISGQLDEYLAKNGIIDVDTATTFVTGYDFLTDGATDIADNTERVARPADPDDATDDPTKRLIHDTWGKTDLTNVLLGANAPTINSLNAHFSHNLLQPAGPTSGQPGAGFTRTDLFSASEIPAPTTNTAGEFTSTLLGRLLFSMGCHGGLNVDDRLGPAAAESLDWAQVNAQQRAAVFIANTGYGYGDTVANALSERLLTIFSRLLADPSTTLAEKLVLAKHEYFSTMGTYGVFDEKVLIEMSYYGLPFWRVGPEGPGPAGPMPPAVVDGKAPIAIDAVAEGVTRIDDLDRGTYWATGADREVAFSAYRPLQPLITKSVTVEGQTATGVLLKSLVTTDIEVDDFARAMPTIDLSSNEPEQSANGDIYPANLVRLSTSKPFGELDQKLVVIAGQSRGDDTGPGGVERLVQSLDVDVLYGTGPEPSLVIQQVASQFTPGVAGPGTVAFQSKVNGPADQAYALYRVEGSDKWTLEELFLNQATGLWEGVAEVTTGLANPRIELLVQYVNNGRVFSSTNKGFFFNALIDDSQAPTITVTSPAPNQVFVAGQRVAADYACTDPNLLACEGDVPDGGVLDTTIPGPRVFTVEAVDRAGNRQLIEVPYSVAGGEPEPDTTGPAIAITSPAAITYGRNTTVLADYACDDPSGVATCTGPVADGAAIDTSTLGPKSFTVNAEDALGNESTKTVTYTVVDNVAPSVTITTPANNGRYKLNSTVLASYSCADDTGGSGLASCAGTVANGQPIDTSTIGPKDFYVTAIDNQGNPTTVKHTYHVDYVFDGFYTPVNNLPTFNVMSAGAAVPVKFRLFDAEGVQTTTTAAVAVDNGQPAITSQKVACTGGDPDPIEQTVTAGSSGLRYDTTAQQFIYTWKTDKSWANTCRVLQVKFIDGLTYTANFSFK